MSASLRGDNSPGVTAEKKIHDQKGRKQGKLKVSVVPEGLVVSQEWGGAKMLFIED